MAYSSVPPSKAGPDDLIEIWNPQMEFEGEHAADIDVTGGIGLKATRGCYDCCKRYRCCLINGEIPERVLDAIEGNTVIGTRIESGNC